MKYGSSRVTLIVCILCTFVHNHEMFVTIVMICFALWSKGTEFEVRKKYGVFCMEYVSISTPYGVVNYGVIVLRCLNP